MPPGEYGGRELEMFAAAVNWKARLKRELEPYLDGEVLEAGAGIGATTSFLCGAGSGRWVCLEPDRGMADRIKARIASSELPPRCEVFNGTVADLPRGTAFDAALYVDVLEHIADDAAELASAAERLKPGGRLIVLSPAHQRLYSEFDREIGHFRRYSRGGLRALTPAGTKLIRLDYLDSAGLLASLANRLLLRSGMPTPGQIRLWDGVLVRISRFLDPLLARRLGKSVLAVWLKP
jgi:SAM-dependent methyltransferase